MIFPLGSAVNAGAIVVGATLGMLLGERLQPKVRVAAFQALGLCTMALGLQMTFKTQNPLYMIISVLAGVIIGETILLDEKINQGGEWLKRRLRSNNSRFTEGFISASLLFGVGAMAIIGPLNEGLLDDYTVIYTKTILDFFASIIFGATLGSGVLFSALPVFVMQGLITILAQFIEPFLTKSTIAEVEATGGIAIMAIGLNLLDIKQMRIANFLPSLVIIVILCTIAAKWF